MRGERERREAEGEKEREREFIRERERERERESRPAMLGCMCRRLPAGASLRGGCMAGRMAAGAVRENVAGAHPGWLQAWRGDCAQGPPRLSPHGHAKHLVGLVIVLSFRAGLGGAPAARGRLPCPQRQWCPAA